MRLHEAAELLNLNLKIEASCYPADNYRVAWTARFDNVEVKRGVMLESTYGSGTTPQAAVKDYIAKLRGEDLVVNAYSPAKRHEFKLPKSVTP